MNLKPILASLTPGEKPPQWGEFQTGWGNAVFLVTPRGLAALQPVMSDEAFQQLVDDHFKPAGIQQLTPGQRTLWSQKISEALVHPGLIQTLPLDLQGSAFQKAVWEQLLQIPSGKTLSYSEVAARVGRPRAIRAVASACGANPVPLLIPCHRVLRKNGQLGGYALGLDLKRRLLHKEGAL
jgi:AraC family transcriptional regulator of adaptative response/methylated-DNA-[protein]-cysteine methyltransferase